MTRIFEDDIEQWMVEELSQGGFTFIPPDLLDPDKSTDLRVSYHEVVIESYLASALQRINPQLSSSVLQLAVKEVLRIPSTGDQITANQNFHKLLTEGIDVTFLDKSEEKTVKAKLVDDLNPSNNQWNITHQVTIIENGQQKRPDVLIYLNGIPVIVIELKNAADQNATIEKAYQQLQTYHKTIPTLFTYNCFEIISDGLEAKAGTITSDLSRFMSWKSSDGATLASSRLNELSVMMEGLLKPEVLVDVMQNFIVYEKITTEDARTKTIRILTVKKLAAYHQYYAVKKAVISTSKASAAGGNRKGGVVWHTQGSG
jgi:type I restriction enzyme R subunit